MQIVILSSHPRIKDNVVCTSKCEYMYSFSSFVHELISLGLLGIIGRDSGREKEGKKTKSAMSCASRQGRDVLKGV